MATPQQVTDFIVALMPDDQKESVRHRLDAAYAAGWTSIGIWDRWDENCRHPLPPDQDDIFGVSPDGLKCQPVP